MKSEFIHTPLSRRWQRRSQYCINYFLNLQHQQAVTNSVQKTRCSSHASIPLLCLSMETCPSSVMKSKLCCFSDVSIYLLYNLILTSKPWLICRVPIRTGTPESFAWKTIFNLSASMFIWWHLSSFQCLWQFLLDSLTAWQQSFLLHTKKCYHMQLGYSGEIFIKTGQLNGRSVWECNAIILIIFKRDYLWQTERCEQNVMTC